MEAFGYSRRFLLNALLILRIALAYWLLSWQRPFLPQERYLKKMKALHQKFAHIFFKHAIRMKGVLIKVGQFLSTRVDIMPVEYTDKLSELQDRVPPVPYSVIAFRILKDLERPVEQIFSSFSQEPIAAASFGQVHEALLKDGRHVAVKVQYPDIERVVREDLKAIRFGLKLLKLYIKNVELSTVYQEMSRHLLEELDYIQEGRNAEEIRRRLASNHRILVPQIYWEYCTDKVLTMEFLEGEKITDFARRTSDPSLKRSIAELLISVYWKQILVDGFFHADPHPGNLFVTGDHKLILVDFGMCKRIPPDVRQGCRRLVRAFLVEDPRAIAEGFRAVGIITLENDLNKIREIYTLILQEVADLSPRQFKTSPRLARVSEKVHKILRRVSSIQIPSDLLMVSRATGLLEGLMAELDPQLNFLQLSKPHIKRFLEEERDGHGLLFQGLQERAKLAWILPQFLYEFLTRANQGDLVVRTEEMAFKELSQRVMEVGRLMILGLLISFCGTVYLILYFFAQGQGEWLALVGLGLFTFLFLKTYGKLGR